MSRLRATGDALYRAAGIEVEHHDDEVAGLRTHWVTAGHPDSPHAVLLHGSGGSAALWYPALAALAERRHVVAVDMPGHGETSIPVWPSPGTMERMLEWLAQFLDRFDWPLLIGHSLGGYMALLHFSRLRPSVAGLVLVDAGGVGPRPPGFVMATRHPVLGALLGLAAGARPTRRRMEGTIRRLCVDPYRIPHGQLALDYALETASRPRATRFQFEISLPTLLVWGERDYFPLAYARQAADEMPAARLEVLRGTGHLSYLEDPEAFNEVLGGWIQATYEK